MIRSRLVTLIFTLAVLFTLCEILTSCTVKRGQNEYTFLKSQISENHITIETESGIGAKVNLPGDTADFWIGFIKHTFTYLPTYQCIEYYVAGVLDRKICTEAPSVDVDTSFDIIKSDLSDSVVTGKAAETLREEVVGGEVK